MNYSTIHYYGYILMSQEMIYSKRHFYKVQK